MSVKDVIVYIHVYGHTYICVYVGVCVYVNNLYSSQILPILVEFKFINFSESS